MTPWMNTQPTATYCQTIVPLSHNKLIALFLKHPVYSYQQYNMSARIIIAYYRLHTWTHACALLKWTQCAWVSHLVCWQQSIELALSVLISSVCWCVRLLDNRWISLPIECSTIDSIVSNVLYNNSNSFAPLDPSGTDSPVHCYWCCCCCHWCNCC